MSLRCPSSTYIGVARLSGYRWMINSRGYANVVQTSNSSDEVYGLVYTLTPSDEARLDVNEGVPYSYTKEHLKADFWASRGEESVDIIRGGPKAKVVELLVYIDRNRVKDDVPKQEYIYRINMGVRDALDKGVPGAYVDRVIRRFIPEQSGSGVEELADKQAMSFDEQSEDTEGSRVQR